MHPDLGAFSEINQDHLKYAELFSQVMHGASILYNVLLAELSGREQLLEEHSDRIRKWRDQFQGNEKEISSWAHDLTPFWNFIDTGRYNVGARTRDFIGVWCERVVATHGSILEDDSARRLVRQREEVKKRANSRFLNERALDQWGGKSGIDRLIFRWNTARTFIDDIVDALEE